MFWAKKFTSLFRTRVHRVTILRPPSRKKDEAFSGGSHTVSVREGGMLLDALLKRGVEYPHLCKLGDCRRCKSVLISGTIERAGHYEGALSEDEIARRIFLACRATPTGDCSMHAFTGRN